MQVTDNGHAMKVFSPVPARFVAVPAIIFMRMARPKPAPVVPQSNTFSSEIIQPIAITINAITAAAAARDFSRESTLAGMSFVLSQ